MKHLSIKFIVFGLVFYSSANIITLFLIAVPLSNLISSMTNEGEVTTGIYPPSIIISVVISKIFASFAAAGYIVRYVKTFPMYHALVIGILAAIIGAFINEISADQAYLKWAMALCSIVFIVISTYCLKTFGKKHV